eukprot:8223638-Prorocentrum_lima.AAC.1
MPAIMPRTSSFRTCVMWSVSARERRKRCRRCFYDSSRTQWWSGKLYSNGAMVINRNGWLGRRWISRRPTWRILQ